MSLPEITDEDRAIETEAYRLWRDLSPRDPTSQSQIAAALVRTGRMPVDPDLILAREILASKTSCTLTAAQYRSGDNDGYFVVEATLATIQAAVQRERERNP